VSPADEELEEPNPHDELIELTRAVQDQLRWQRERGGRGVMGTLPARSVAKAGARPVAAKPAAAPSGSPPWPAAAPVSAPARVTTPTVSVTTFGAGGLQLIRDELGDCTRCKLAGGRQQIVFGVGSPDAPLMFVGEAPGAEEDRTGEPFVGAAGQLLTKMIEAMGFAREQVYIANITKCRPPGNRNPEPDEIASCEPFLKKQIAAIRPRVLVCLGKFAAQTLLATDAPISRLRGGWTSYEGIPLMPTFHPAFLLRNPSSKKEVWSDLQQVMGKLRELGLLPQKKS
jgi:uracil-DNA glycosylase family 4